MFISVGFSSDSAFFDHDTYQTLIATAWTAFVDVTEYNGCLQVRLCNLSYEVKILLNCLKSSTT